MDKQRRLFTLVIAFVVVLVVGCAAPKPPLAIYLPTLKLHSSINTSDGVDQREAGFIAGAYLARYVSGCGMPGDPVLENDWWVTKLYVGFVGGYAGKFHISRTTGDVVYEPYPNRLTPSRMESLSLGIARTERERSAPR